MFFPARTLATLLALAALLCAARAQTARDTTVELTATVQESPAAITLQWNPTVYQVYSQTVLRRVKDAPKWTVYGAPAVNATTFTDTAVTAGVSYEYYVVRRVSILAGFASGYISSGIRVPPVVDRGRVLLLVDDTMATPLATELNTFIRDLNGDGWTVIRTDISRSTATVPGVRGTIQSLYAADTARTVALILFGRIPVPYSGDFAIDGHFYDHYGAWPTDAYYGDMDGVWTDTFINDIRAGDPRVRNVPGDGKYDQTVLPSAVELQVGRIDLSNLPVFGVSETELLRRYLNRNHNYRHRLGAFASVPQRGLVDDNFGYFGGEAFASTAWRGFTPCVGSGNVASLDWFTTLNTQPYLWALGCGGGSYFQCSGVGTTADFNSMNSLAVFNVLFGSYFGDWDNSNNFLRAPLAGTAASFGLASVWSGRPHWAFHSMAMGETIGYTTRVTQNNDNSIDEGYETGYGAQFNHLALLGDPTLRLYPVTPPVSLSAIVAPNAVTLNWSASPDAAIEGYVVARSSVENGPFTPLRGSLVSGTSYVDRNVTPGAVYSYLVRPVKLETSPSGTYFNPGQGIYADAVTAVAAAGPELNLSGLGASIAAGDMTPLTVNGTDFGTLETTANLARTFTIANPGTTPLTITALTIGGANAGDFVVTTPPPSLIAAGGSGTFVVRFQPLTIGARAAGVTVTSDNADEPIATFALGGTGIAPAPALALHPPAIYRSIHAGDSANETVAISNPSLGTLQHTVTSSLTRYSALDSDSFAGPTYAWIDISTTGALVPSWSGTDDGVSSPLPLGFTFPFYGTNFTSVRVCTNGYLSFSDPNTSAENTTLPNRRAARNQIAIYWADLNIDTTSRVYTQNLGGNYIVQFENVSLNGQSALRVTCQAILKPGGEILLQYKSLPASVDYTIGVQNGTADDGLTISAHAPYAHANFAIRIRPPGAETWLAPGSTSATLAAGQTQHLVATLNAAGLAPGNYAAELQIASNAAATPSATIPVRLTVGNTPVEDWRLARFGSTTETGNAADSANPDGDFRTNLLEYAFDSIPTVLDPPGSPMVGRNGSGYLQIQFSRHTGRTDLRYLVEASSDLNGVWTTIASSVHGAVTTANGAHSTSENGAGFLKTVTVEDVAPASTFPKRYLRVRVVRD